MKILFTKEGLFSLLQRRGNHLNSIEWKGITEKLEQMLETLKYGSITLIVQDGKVIQIEKHEKVRIQNHKR